MKIIFDSLTGNVKRFVSKLPYESHELKSVNELKEPFVLVTYTINFGEIPISTNDFLTKYSHLLKGVASSGNRIWGSNFAVSADKISEKYKVPSLLKFELSGNNSDVKEFISKVEQLDLYNKITDKIEKVVV